MTAHSSSSATPAQPTAPVLAGVVAEYGSPEQLTQAARQVREAGWTKFEAHSPFPIHGIDDAVGMRPTVLPWITFTAAATGALGAILMQWWMNAYDYKLLISGKPLFSIPSSIPVVFECAILLASFTTLGAMLALNGLPRFGSPWFRSERFRKVTSHGFFLTIEGTDPKFQSGSARQVLEASGASAVDECWVDPNEGVLPVQPFVVGGLILASVLMIPVSIIFRMRNTDSDQPRIHVIQDMDFQPKFKTQKVNPLFADRRSMRPPVSGSVARGELEDNDRLYRGLDGDASLLMVAFQPPTADGTAPAAGNVPAANADGAGPAPLDPLDKLPWVKDFPIPVTMDVMKRGQERYGIYCANCHGLGGEGDGLVTLRAMELEQGTWVKPVSYHTDPIRTQPVGRLFHSITHGVRKMPAMGDLVSVEDRWAILLYVRALQRARFAKVDDVPAEIVPQLQDVR